MNGIKAVLVCSLSMLATTATTRASANDGNTDTGGELIQICNQTSYETRSPNWQSCIEYVSGVLDGFLWADVSIYDASVMKGTKPDAKSALNKLLTSFKSYCAPDLVTLDQLGLVMSKYLADNPAKLNQSKVSLVLAAMDSAWPCPTNSK
ncbi:MAG TPA: Rap1a/Tai family immunity protein [Gammaproteobacteria bacterium]|jgi:hypothetical protein